MAKRSASSARVRRVAKKNLAIPDSRIDYSDIPPISREQLRRMKRVGDRALSRSQVKHAVIRIF